MNALTIVVRFPVRPDRREAFEEAFAELLAGLTAEPSFVEARVHRDVEGTADVVFYETYAETKESFLARVPGRDFFKAFLARLPDLLHAERRVDWLERTDVVPPPASSTEGSKGSDG